MKKRFIIDSFLTTLKYKIIPPKWTEEQLAEMKINLAIRLYDEYAGTRPMANCSNEAKNLVEGVPTELLINIDEWIHNLPLSNIKVHGISVNDVFDRYGRARPIHFIKILHCMCRWKETDYFKGTNIFANHFTLM